MERNSPSFFNLSNYSIVYINIGASFLDNLSERRKLHEVMFMKIERSSKWKEDFIKIRKSEPWDNWTLYKMSYEIVKDEFDYGFFRFQSPKYLTNLHISSSNRSGRNGH